MADTLLSPSVAVLYLVMASWISLAIYREKLPRTQPVLIVCGAALGLHLWLLHDQLVLAHGQDLSMLNVATTAAWFINLMLLITHLRRPIHLLLPLAFSVTAILLVADYLMPGQYITHLETHPRVLLHIALSLTAYSLLMVVALLALLLAVINHRLKHKKQAVFHPALPPLVSVEELLYHLLFAGVVVLAAAQLTGLVFLEQFFGGGKAHKAILSLIALGVYLMMLWRHYSIGLRGRWLVIGSISGGVLLTLAYFGSRFIREILLS